jgi:hypothetical protein
MQPPVVDETGLEAQAAQAEADRQMLLFWVWVLLLVSFCMVAFSTSLAELFTPWRARSFQELEATSHTIRSIGFLLFGFGLVERILLRFCK